MILDSDSQRQFLLEVLNNVTLPGALLDLAFHTKQQLLLAEIKDPAPVEKNG